MIVQANWFQFGRGERIHHSRVLSRMLLWCVSGKGRIQVNGRAISLAANHWFFLPWAREITYEADPERPFLVGGIHAVGHRGLLPRVPTCIAHNSESLAADDAWISDLDWPEYKGMVSGSFQPRDQLQFLAAYTVECFQLNQPDLDERVALAVLLRRELRRSLPSGFAKAVPGKLLYLQTYVKDHLRETLTTNELARVAGLSLSSLSRIFRQYTGRSPSRWIAGVRCDAARRLLQSTTLTVREVGEQVGWVDPFHFSRVFRNLAGVSPRRYREQNRIL